MVEVIFKTYCEEINVLDQELLLDVGKKCSNLFCATFNSYLLSFFKVFIKSLQHLLMISFNLGENKLVLNHKRSIYCTLSQRHDPLEVLPFSQP